MYQSSILLVDNDAQNIFSLEKQFNQEGAFVKSFSNALSAYEYLKVEQIVTDIILTDWTLPQLDGLEFCKLLKRTQKFQHIPIVMISNRDSEIDAVTALEVGAEDYIRKPLKIRELITRVKKILQRHKEQPSLNGKSFLEEKVITQKMNNESIMLSNGIKIDTYRHKAYLFDTELNLTYSEFKLLELFISNPGRVYQRSTLIEKINGIDYCATERSVDVMIVGLRKKLGSQKKVLETVRGVGYRFLERI